LCFDFCIQEDLLPQFSDFEFHTLLSAQIPRLTTLITDVTRAEFLAWLSYTKSRSRVVGALALAKMDREMRIEDFTLRRLRAHKLAGLTGIRVASLSSSLSGPLPSGPNVGLGDIGRLVEDELFAPPPPLKGLAVLADTAESTAPAVQRSKALTAAAAAAAAGDPAAPALLSSSSSSSASASAAGTDSNGAELSVFERAGVSYAELHRALHTYAALDQQAAFYRLYSERRQAHALQLGSFPAQMPAQEFMFAYLQYFSDIIGFFVVEDAVLVNGAPILTRTMIETLWDTALSKLKGLVATVLPQITSPADALAVKHAVLVFARTAERHGFSAAPLLDVATINFATYERLLVLRFSADSATAIDEDKRESFQATSAEQYIRGVLAYALAPPPPANTAAGAKAGGAGAGASTALTAGAGAGSGSGLTVAGGLPFAQPMPFSIGIVTLHRLVKDVASGLCSYAAGLSPSLHPLVWRALDAALLRIDALLNAGIDRGLTTKMERLILNASCLGDACGFFTAYVHTLLTVEAGVAGAFAQGEIHRATAAAAAAAAAADGKVVKQRSSASVVVAAAAAAAAAASASGGAGSAATAMSTYVLQARAAFAHTRGRCESLLFELLDVQIDKILSITFTFEWTATKPSTQPSAYVATLTNSLSAWFGAIPRLAPAVRDSVHYTACRHVSASLLHFIQQAPKFTQMAMYNFSRDVVILERFIAQFPVPSLKETFAELRQFLDLVITADTLGFAEEAVRVDKYPNVNPAKAAKILEKFKEASEAPPGAPQLKRKAVDTLISALKKTLFR